MNDFNAIPYIFFEQSADGILIIDVNTKKFAFANPSMCTMLGYAKDDLVQLSLPDIHPADSLHIVMAEFEALITNKKILVPAIPCLRKDGTIFYADISCSMLGDWGIGIFNNISLSKKNKERFKEYNEILEKIVENRTNELLILNKELKKQIRERELIEISLKESEKKFMMAFNLSPYPMSISTEANGRFIEINNAFTKIIGYTRRELIGRTSFDINFWVNDSERSKMIGILQKYGKLFEYEFMFYNKAGLKRTGLGSGEYLNISDEKLVLNVIQDITERKHMENALRKSDEKFRTIADYTSDWEYWQDVDDGFIYVSPSCERITGYTVDEFLCNPELLYKIIHPDDKKKFINYNKGPYERGDTHSLDFRIITKDQKMRWIGHVSQTVYDENGIAIGRRGSSRDITKQKNVELALIESENKYRTIFESTGALTVIINKDYTLLLINEKFEKFSGFMKLEIETKKSLLDFIPDEEHKKFEFYYEFPQEIVRNKTKVYQTILRNKSENIINVLANICRIPGTEQYVVSMFDITKTLQLEKEVLEISLREQNRIGRDLHDNLGQHLTGLAYMCKSLEKRLKETSVKESRYVSKIVRQINTYINQTRIISKGLSPLNLESNSLEDALREYGEDINKIYGVTFKLKYNKKVVIEDSMIATQLFYIIKEAVNNAVKHGKSIKNILILLTLKNKILNVKVKDDGVGICEHYEKRKGLGIKIMQYRANLIKGSLEIKKNADLGTTVSCILKID